MNDRDHTPPSGPYVLGFEDIDSTSLSLAGGKGAKLGELSGIEGINVPKGFCVTTEAYKLVTANQPELDSLLDALSGLKAEDKNRLAELSEKIREIIEALPVTDTVRQAIFSSLEACGETEAYAVRSSATAEDLPAASFAGQQDSYLNIAGKEEVLRHVRRCWASLFTVRAVIYRLQNGFDHRKVQIAVVVQQMVFPQASGILFTADPVSANRNMAAIDASFGLGEALVSGLVNADHYKVNSEDRIEKQVAVKKLAIHAAKEGGTTQQEIQSEQQTLPALSDAQILKLAGLGRKIEHHFGCPQDIEWCLMNDRFYIVQSRPVTTLYPIPETSGAGFRAYVSVGHQQMMTDAMKPLGWSVHQLMAARAMYQAGGRLFVDITEQLASPAGREMLLKAMGQHDPLLGDALATLTGREDILRALSQQKEQGPPKSHAVVSASEPPLEKDPAIVAELIARSKASLETLKQTIQERSGAELLDFILEDIRQLKKILFDSDSMSAIMASMNASAWLNQHLQSWLGETNAADVLAQSVTGNITSEMGLELLDVADAIRPYPEVIAYLQQAKEKDDLLEGLPALEGGQEVRQVLLAYLDKYGMRCAGEIDITKTRWSENPALLVPLILGNIKNFEPDESRRRFGQGRQEAMKKKQELLERLEQLPDGAQKATQAVRMIDQLRHFAGYREYPKYDIVNRYFIYKQALLREAEELLKDGIIRELEDVYYLRYEELRELVHTHQLKAGLIAERKQEHRMNEKLSPPRLITSEGEIFAGRYKREGLPAAALSGLAVSSGLVEGRARVILNMEEAALEEGDILVTTFTDPSWTPLFVGLTALVTEVGGLMTHGAVIAREYGLPAVVGVEQATKLIKDGQRIRVNGTEGYVELL